MANQKQPIRINFPTIDKYLDIDPDAIFNGKRIGDMSGDEQVDALVNSQDAGSIFDQEELGFLKSSISPEKISGQETIQDQKEPVGLFGLTVEQMKSLPMEQQKTLAQMDPRKKTLTEGLMAGPLTALGMDVNADKTSFKSPETAATLGQVGQGLVSAFNPLAGAAMPIAFKEAMKLGEPSKNVNELANLATSIQNIKNPMIGGATEFLASFHPKSFAGKVFTKMPEGASMLQKLIGYGAQGAKVGGVTTGSKVLPEVVNQQISPKQAALETIGDAALGFPLGMGAGMAGEVLNQLAKDPLKPQATSYLKQFITPPVVKEQLTTGKLGELVKPGVVEKGSQEIVNLTPKNVPFTGQDKQSVLSPIQKLMQTLGVGKPVVNTEGQQVGFRVLETPTGKPKTIEGFTYDAPAMNKLKDLYAKLESQLNTTLSLRDLQKLKSDFGKTFIKENKSITDIAGNNALVDRIGRKVNQSLKDTIVNKVSTETGPEASQKLQKAYETVNLGKELQKVLKFGKTGELNVSLTRNALQKMYEQNKFAKFGGIKKDLKMLMDNLDKYKSGDVNLVRLPFAHPRNIEQLIEQKIGGGTPRIGGGSIPEIMSRMLGKVARHSAGATEELTKVGQRIPMFNLMRQFASEKE